MKPLLVATVTAPTTAELRRARDEVRGADLVELRLDSVADPNVAGALAGRKGPVILTCRAAWEGGRFAGSEEERRTLLADALKLGAEYVDIEWRAGFDDLIAGAGGRRIVLSSHDFDAVPADLAGRVRAMRSTGVQVVKCAVTPSRLADLIGLKTFGAEAGRDNGLVLIAMGETGLLTRVMPHRFGSAWTYAGAVSEVGQLAMATMIEEYGANRVGEMTALYGVAGRPIAHSVSPAMHNAAFRAARLDAVYVPLAAADADDLVAFGRAFDLRGASVTIPFKVALCDRVDELYPSARHVGALNTVRVEGGRWIGANTDVNGFIEPLKARVPVAGLRVSILGAGGSARAAAHALTSSGARVTIHARDASKAAAVAAIASGAHAGEWPPAAGSWDVLVNCTPVGMHPRVDDTPLPAALLTGRCVYDLVYNPPVTRLLREAEAAGCATIGGLEMLVAQACEQFQWWTGVRPAPQVMRQAAEARLASYATVI